VVLLFNQRVFLSSFSEVLKQKRAIRKESYESYTFDWIDKHLKLF
jgi:hypothetical protein